MLSAAKHLIPEPALFLTSFFFKLMFSLVGSFAALRMAILPLEQHTSKAC